MSRGGYLLFLPSIITMTTNQKVSININASNVDIALTSFLEAKPTALLVVLFTLYDIWLYFSAKKDIFLSLINILSHQKSFPYYIFTGPASLWEYPLSTKSSKSIMHTINHVLAPIS